MPEIYAVHDAADAVEHRDFVHDLARPDQGLLVASITPGNRSTKGLTEDLLSGLGKRAGMGAMARHSGERWPKVIAWLVAEQVRTVIVSRAHLLDGRAWQVLCELSCVCDFALYLLVQRGSLTRGQADQIERWPVQVIRWAEFEGKWSATRDADRALGATRGPAAFPHVPTDEFTTFGAACRSRLSAEDFARVESEVSAVRKSTRSWTNTDLDEERLALFLMDLVESSCDLDQAMTRLRAVQLELFNQGYLVKLRVDVLAEAVNARSLPELNGAAAERLRGYSTTAHPAAGALVLAGGLNPHQVVACNVGDVKADGSAACHGREDVSIVEAARPLVRAHRLFRLMQGARPEDPLFLSEIRQPGTKQYRRTPPEIMHAFLTKTSRQCGIALTRRHERGKGTSARAWMRRRGVSVQRLAPNRASGRSAS